LLDNQAQDPGLHINMGLYTNIDLHINMGIYMYSNIDLLTNIGAWKLWTNFTPR